MYINFQQNRVGRSIKTAHTNLLAKHRKLHKFSTCNLNFEKSCLSDMHYPITNIQADFEINRPIRYQITVKRNYSTDDRLSGKPRTTTIGSFFRKKITKNENDIVTINKHENN